MNPSDVKEVILTLLSHAIRAMDSSVQASITQASLTNNFNIVIRTQGALDVLRSAHETIQELPLNKSKEETLIYLGLQEVQNEPS